MRENMKLLQLSGAFILELVMLAAFAYWGFHTGTTTLSRVILGIGAPLLVAAIWGVFMAPRSARQLRGGAYVALKAVLFGLAAVALIVAGQAAMGIVLGAIFLISLRWAR